MSDTAYKAYFKRNLQKVVAQLGTVALLDEVAESNLSSALATKINGKADSTTVSTISGKVDTLIGNVTGDDAKSARGIAAEEVAKIVANADSSFDTLKEIADWISTHSESASAMNSAIIALQAKLVLGTYIPDGESDPVQYSTVKAYVEAYVAQQIASNITLASLSIGTATGSGNVITGLSYDSTTGEFTPSKGLTAIELDDLSVGTASGAGNVITAISYDDATGVFTPTKGVTAITEADLVDLTDAEVTALFASA